MNLELLYGALVLNTGVIEQRAVRRESRVDPRPAALPQLQQRSKQLMLVDGLREFIHKGLHSLRICLFGHCPAQLANIGDESGFHLFSPVARLVLAF